MTILKEHQFEILPSSDAMDGFVFGVGAEVSVDGEGGFDPGETSWFTQDGENTRRGTIGFGRDKPSARVWTWQSHVDQEGVESAVNVLEDFADMWQPEAAETPGWTTAIRYELAGRTRRVFGRPRRFAAPPTNLILNGYIPVSHDFQLVDTFTYDDLETTAQILYSSGASGGGFEFPVTFPIQTLSSEGVGSGQISVGGSARAYPRVRFNGPWTDPVMETDNWRLAWTGTIPSSGWVEIDARPWKLTVLNQDGASVVEGLSRQTWLEDCWFAPRSRPGINLGGVAPSGSASATLAWRNTFKSM